MEHFESIPKQHKIVTSHDFSMALQEDRLDEAEEYLWKEKKEPSALAHDDLWWNNRALALYQKYRHQGNEQGCQRIFDQLPPDWQRTVRPEDKQKL